MKLFSVLFAIVCCVSPGRGGDESWEVFIGTYTRGESRGIYRAELNRKDGSLSEATLAAEIENPSFLALSPDRERLFAVIETGKFNGEDGGGLAGFRIAGDKLEKLNARNTGGGAPCHLSIDPAGRVVLVANYSGGNVASFLIGDDGLLSPYRSLIQHEGSSIDERRQKGPHAHGIEVFGDGKFAAAADLGTDSVFVYRIDGEGGLEQVSEVRLQPGSGARHLTFHPSGKFAYVINELSLTVAAFSLKSRTEWETLQYIPTLPEGVGKIGSTAEIQMHPSGRFVYGSNRGHDTIVCYAIDQEKGTLGLIEHEPIRGSVPRGFGITPDGRFLLAGGQKSGTVTVFAIDADKGTLEFTGHRIEVPSPVSLVFR